MKALPVAAAVVCVLALATTAVATTRHTDVILARVKLTLQLPDTAFVKFHDHGGSCEADKATPGAYVSAMKNTSVNLFYGRSTAACLSSKADAQYKVVVTLKDGATLWSFVNVVQEHILVSAFLTHCYGNGTLPCEGGHNGYSLSDGLHSPDIPLRLGPLPAGPAGYEYCAPEGETCKATGTASIAFGVHDKFTTKTLSGSVHCTTGTFGDPAPGVRKSCFIKAG